MKKLKNSKFNKNLQENLYGVIDNQLMKNSKFEGKKNL